jgi:hypothetical protein
MCELGVWIGRVSAMPLLIVSSFSKSSGAARWFRHLS